METALNPSPVQVTCPFSPGLYVVCCRHLLNHGQHSSGYPKEQKVNNNPCSGHYSPMQDAIS